MKKIMSQEGTAASFGFDLRERKPLGSLSAKLNDKNTSYFRITWATSPTLLFTLFLLHRPFACLVSLSRCPVLIRDFAETRASSLPSFFARYFTMHSDRDIASFLLHRKLNNALYSDKGSRNSMLGNICQASKRNIANVCPHYVRYILAWIC